MKDCYGVTFQGLKAKKEVIGSEVLRKAFNAYKTNKHEKLSTPDLQVFKTETDADKFVSDFHATAKTLPLLKNKTEQCKSALVSKRHHLALILLGKKMKTERRHKIKAEAGDLVCIHDQTYYVPVRLTSVRQDGDSYIYEYENHNTQGTGRIHHG